ncbi:MAG: hypothetical protein IPK16_20445 [Anaerolineales bacterium]|nr:hypothetical protein [Anaerolineales bacterium]
MGDTGANQIYRYDPGQYAEPPEPWFEATTQVALEGMRVMRIDGDIWVLYDDGKVVRYRAGEQVPYSLDGTVGLPAAAVDLYVSQGGDTALYLADAADERVMRFDKETGEFLGQYQAADGHPLRGLKSIFVDEARGMFYALTDEALYQQRLPR